MISHFADVIKKASRFIYADGKEVSLRPIKGQVGYQSDVCLHVHEQTRTEFQARGKPLYLPLTEIFDDLGQMLKDFPEMENIRLESNTLRFQPSEAFLRAHFMKAISADSSSLEFRRATLIASSGLCTSLDAVVQRFYRKLFRAPLLDPPRDLPDANRGLNSMLRRLQPSPEVIYHSSFIDDWALLKQRFHGLRGWHWGSFSPFSANLPSQTTAENLLFLWYYFAFKRRGLQVLVTCKELSCLHDLNRSIGFGDAVKDLTAPIEAPSQSEEWPSYERMLALMHLEDGFEVFRRAKDTQIMAQTLQKLMCEVLKEAQKKRPSPEKRFLQAFLKRYMPDDG